MASMHRQPTPLPEDDARKFPATTWAAGYAFASSAAVCVQVWQPQKPSFLAPLPSSHLSVTNLPGQMDFRLDTSNMPSVSNNIGKILPSPVTATILLPPPLSTITGTLPVPCPALKTSLFLFVVSLSTPAAVNVSCFPPPPYVPSAPVSMCSFVPLLHTMSLLVCHCFRWMTLNALQIAGTHGCFAPFSVQCGSAQYLSLEGSLFQQMEC